MLHPFQIEVPFLYPLKTSEKRDFLTFSGGIEMERGREMG